MGSRLAESALPVAAPLAKRLKGSMTLIHVTERQAPSERHHERHLVSAEEAAAYLDEVAHPSRPRSGGQVYSRAGRCPAAALRNPCSTDSWYCWGRSRAQKRNEPRRERGGGFRSVSVRRSSLLSRLDDRQDLAVREPCRALGAMRRDKRARLSRRRALTSLEPSGPSGFESADTHHGTCRRSVQFRRAAQARTGSRSPPNRA